MFVLGGVPQIFHSQSKEAQARISGLIFGSLQK
jgi:hypothetical protein